MATVDKKTALKTLIERGKTEGKLTRKEVEDLVTEYSFGLVQIDKLYDVLEEQNIEIVDDVSEEPQPEELMFTDDDDDFIDEVPDPEEDLESVLSVEGIAIDDPVKVYLKEIGRVDLLSP